MIWLFIGALKDTFKRVQIELIKLKNRNYKRASASAGVKTENGDLASGSSPDGFVFQVRDAAIVQRQL